MVELMNINIAAPPSNCFRRLCSLSSVGNDQNRANFTCSNTFVSSPKPNETFHIVIHLEGKLHVIFTCFFYT